MRSRVAVSRRVAILSPPVATAGFLLLMVLTWVMTNPPFAAPDEPAHYVRAIGITQGHLIGPRAPYPNARSAHVSNQLMLEWVNDATTQVAVPAGMTAPGLTCEVTLHHHRSAQCLTHLRRSTTVTMLRSPVGNYQPVSYMLPALVMTPFHTPFSALRAARIGAAAGCLALLVLAVAACWNGRLLSLAGLAVATTPTALFVCSTLNPSGWETASGIAFAAVLLRILRSGQAQTRWWLAAAGTGAALALSRAPGPAWVVVDVAVIGALCIRRPLRRGLRAWLRSFSRPQLAAIVTVLAATTVNRAWEAAYGSHLRTTSSAALVAATRSAHGLGHLTRQVIGDFGWLTVPLPDILILLWIAAAAVPLTIALRWGSLRERAVLVASAALVILLTLALAGLLVSGTGFAVQGRHLLPFWVVVPLVAAEIALRHTNERQRLVTIAAAATLGVSALVQGLAWVVNSRFYAYGARSPIVFPLRAEWAPPGGWWLWIALVVLAMGWYLTGVVRAGFATSPAEPALATR